MARSCRCGTITFSLLIFLWGGTLAGAQTPPLVVEVHADHPLFLFNTAPEAPGAPAPTGLQVVATWEALPEALRPFSVMRISASDADLEARRRTLVAALDVLQAANVPVAVDVGGGDPPTVLSVAAAEELVRTYTCIKGVGVRDLPFNDYPRFEGDLELAMPPQGRWLLGLLDRIPQYGRFIAIQSDCLGWPRFLANAWCAPIHDKVRENAGYVFPIAGGSSPHTFAGLMALQGLWLDGAVEQWGVAATSAWYTESRFMGPGLFGPPPGPGAMPPSLYRAMVYNGAMIGAAVYAFDSAPDLWAGDRRMMWDAAIAPALRELIDLRLIPRREFVAEKAKVACRLQTVSKPADFQANVRDIDGVVGEGLLIHGAYGMEMPGQVPELIPNTGRHYWVPLLSPRASEETLQRFAAAPTAGTLPTAAAWTELLGRSYTPDGMGTAFISRIGRAVFILNTRENSEQSQTFRLPAMPAPVRGIEARRTPEGVVVTWPFREGDVAYRVYKRAAPRTGFTLVAPDVDAREWVDTDLAPEASASYAVTAFTNEEEPFEGTVGYGEYLALSTVESRIAEEVSIGPLLDYARGRALDDFVDIRPESPPWWPAADGLPPEHQPVAEEIAQRIVALQQAFEAEDLDAVLDLYATDYEDEQGWGFQYARRAYQWFFERYDACRMHRQIRRWSMPPGPDPAEVRVVLYCRFTGVARTDAAGRASHIPVHFPRSESGEITLTFSRGEGVWRIRRADPALPSFADILSYSRSPDDPYIPGPDVYRR